MPKSQNLRIGAADAIMGVGRDPSRSYAARAARRRAADFPGQSRNSAADHAYPPAFVATPRRSAWQRSRGTMARWMESVAESAWQRHRLGMPIRTARCMNSIHAQMTGSHAGAWSRPWFRAAQRCSRTIHDA